MEVKATGFLELHLDHQEDPSALPSGGKVKMWVFSYRPLKIVAVAMGREENGGESPVRNPSIYTVT